MVKKNKLTKDEWQRLKNSVGKFIGDCHHLAGKDYEYLCFLLPLSVIEHRGKKPIRNFKHPDNVPAELKIRAITFWINHLNDEDYMYFFDKGLIDGR